MVTIRDDPVPGIFLRLVRAGGLALIGVAIGVAAGLEAGLREIDAKIAPSSRTIP